MKIDEHPLKLGKIVSNLLFLEFLLRACINKANSEDEPPIEMDKISIGDIVPIDSFTNYDSLGPVVDKYNSMIRSIDPTLVIDRTVIEIRDTIAHGRFYGKTPSPPYVIIKFGKPIAPDKVTVKVENIINANPEWFHKNIMFTNKEFQKAAKAYAILCESD